jgi:hypothetical protein
MLAKAGESDRAIRVKMVRIFLFYFERWASVWLWRSSVASWR